MRGVTRARTPRRRPKLRRQPRSPPNRSRRPTQGVAVRRRRDWLTRGVERCVWNEYDREEAGEFTGDSLLQDLHERLADLQADADGFLALDPDDLLVQLCKDLGVTPPKFHPPAPAATNGHDSS